MRFLRALAVISVNLQSAWSSLDFRFDILFHKTAVEVIIWKGKSAHCIPLFKGLQRIPTALSMIQKLLSSVACLPTLTSALRLIVTLDS